MRPWTLEKSIDADALPDVLRRLAEVLDGTLADGPEQGPGGGFAGLPPLLGAGRLQRLELVAQARESGGYAVRLAAHGTDKGRARGRGAAPAGMALAANASAAGAPGGSARPGPRPNPRPGEAQARAREKYRQLKKALQADFSALSRAAQAGALPRRDALESFLALAEGMAGLPQPVKDAHGPEAGELARGNAMFLKDAQCLRQAFDAGDVSAFAEALARLERRRGACHAQFR